MLHNVKHLKDSKTSKTKQTKKQNANKQKTKLNNILKRKYI